MFFETTNTTTVNRNATEFVVFPSKSIQVLSKITLKFIIILLDALDSRYIKSLSSRCTTSTKFLEECFAKLPQYTSPGDFEYLVIGK